ncbi:MAG: penicillin-insensitive murein endopeptidase [Magnetospirillum sp.]|nr:penicillin-insensitive murein endopeptidase [Magnetospirillum sp.]
MRVLPTMALVSIVLAAPPAVAASPWAEATAPAALPTASLGSPAAGCLAGAVALPSAGPGFQILRPARNRYWSHPRTIAFVERLGRAAVAAGLGTMLVGDLSQPRGGPMPSGHGSHQSGLDADIWFRLPPLPLGDTERDTPTAVSMVRGAGIDPGVWGAGQARLVELAAGDSEVERIFVNPAIKAELCRTASGPRTWLGKLRPWWGHDEHFHVRLSCPAGAPGCVAQAPVPAGDGCGAELESWLAGPAVPRKKGAATPALPAACSAVLAAPPVAP